MATMTYAARMQQLMVLQKHYYRFSIFLDDMMSFLGFSMTDMQEDIGNYLETSTGDVMVQAQRSEAKTTITAAFCVYCLIHNPMLRVLILSAGGSQAKDISTLIVKLILHMEVLACLRPDRSAGDRVSVESFDVHHELKGIDKSPSVKCFGITANLQGNRADLLIADDIESQKNSRTATMRELLLSITRDFSSIVQHGRIIYLGTPQSSSSIYNSLPARGVQVRIWTGRYPNKDQLIAYGNRLAPYITNRLALNPSLGLGGGLDGKQGKPTDPQLLGEDALQDKELKQGTAFFQLQHMLNTALADGMKYPLKPIALVCMRLNENVPTVVERGVTNLQIQQFAFSSHEFTLSTPNFVSPDAVKPSGRVVFIDPAGGGKNGDETAYACIDHSLSKLFVREVSGIAGGYEDFKMQELSNRVARLKPDLVQIEQNFGFGAFMAVFLPYLRAAGYSGKVEGVYHSSNKEARIIDTLEPIMGRGSLIFDQEAIEYDWESTGRYPMEKRVLYTCLYQLENISRTVGELLHDDRLDALASACMHFVKAMALDQKDEQKKKEQAEIKAFFKDPLQHNRYTIDAPSRRGRNRF